MRWNYIARNVVGQAFSPARAWLCGSRYITIIYSVLDLAAVEGFQWDGGNARKNEKHAVSQHQAEQVFLNQPLLVLEDPKHSGAEPRFHALGRTDEDRLLHVVFTLRASGTLIRVISARPMHRKERVTYAQASQTETNP